MSAEPKSLTVGAMVQERFGFKPKVYQDLGEADRSATPFLPLEEYMAAIREAYQHPDKHIHGWESHHEMFVRNQRIIDELIAENRGKTIAIIGHGGAGTCIKCHLCKLPLSFDQDPQRTGCSFIVEVESGTLVQDWQPYC